MRMPPTISYSNESLPYTALMPLRTRLTLSYRLIVMVSRWLRLLQNGLGDIKETVLCLTSCFDTPFARQHGAPALPYGVLRSLL